MSWFPAGGVVGLRRTGSDEAEAARGDLVDALRVQVLGGVTRKLATELVGQIRVVLLQDTRTVRVGVGHGDHRVALARLREGGVVDAGDAHAECCKA